jgi:16S rRNA (cytosine967-C5)-methyltransferase
MAAADKSVKKPDEARLAACRLLYDVLEAGAYVNLGSISQLDSRTLNSRDRSFASALVYGTVSRLPAIDWYIGRLSERPLTALDGWIRTILRLGLWQIIWGRTIPVSAAVNESVNLAAFLTNKGAAAYVNAVLRAYERQKPEIPRKLEALDYGLPTYLFGLLKKWFGSEEAVDIAEAFLLPQQWTTLRVNPLRSTPAELIEVWTGDGVEAEKGLYLPEAVRIQLGGNGIRRLIAWQEGKVTVQDEAAMLVSRVAAPRQDSLIYDLCAAPGGKTSHLAEIMRNKGRIIAVDSQTHRLNLVSEHMQRLGINIVETICADARFVFDSLNKQDSDDAGCRSDLLADLVLADVPCSGLGLLARKPEIRLSMTYDKIQELLPLQAQILRHGAELVKPGAYLVYSTCTINPDENQGQIENFLQNTSIGDQFCRTDISDYLPEALVKIDGDLADQAKQGSVQLLPNRHNTDGFFICKLQRNKG